MFEEECEQMHVIHKDVLRQPRQKAREPVTKSEPCPICGRDHYCWIALDKSDIICTQVESDKPRDGAGGWLHDLTDSVGSSSYVHPTHLKPKPNPAIDWGKLTADAFEDSEAARQRLAELLGVTTESLTALGVGFESNYWTFPERDAKYNPIGISRRFVAPHKDGNNKRCIKHSTRGLTYAEGWHNAPGPILLPEGGSDTAALLSMGLCAVGRPNNTGGGKLLAELLANHTDRAIIVLGERDEKTDKRGRKHWPGRSGAISTAERLAKELGRTIYWALPPAGAKDSRAYLNQLMPEVNAKRLAVLGKLFLDSLVTEVIEPPERLEVEPYQEPEGELVDLEIWWRDMGIARLETIGKPGLYFDGSPTGAGKSYADREALRQAKTSLTVLRTHANCREAEAELNEAGIPAVAYPKMDEETCKYPDVTSDALKMGLAPTTAVCPGCEHRKRCVYMKQKKAADEADHAIATHARAAKGFVRLAKGKKIVSVHENAEDMLKPMARFQRKHLGDISQVAYEAGKCEQNKPRPDFELVVFFNAMRDDADCLAEQIDNTTETTLIEIPSTMAAPKNWEKRLFRAWLRLIQSTDKETTVHLNGDALRTIVGIVTGELHRLWVCVGTSREKEGGAKRTHKTFKAVWKTALPDDVPIWFADATGRADLLSKLTGRAVADRTPQGRLEQPTRTVQLPQDITRKTAPKTVAALVEGIRAEYPEAKSIGVIGHQPHIKELFGERSELLDESTRKRICQHAYYGQGIDRASNSWLVCDLLIALGTPRTGDEGIQERLIRAGQDEAVKRDGNWGDVAWEGKTESGQVVTVKGRGYRDPEWSQAARDEVHASLIQAVGRGRGVLADGVPVIVFTTENLGLPLADDEIPRVSKGEIEAAKAVSAIVRRTLNTPYKEKANNELATTTAVAKRMGRCKSYTSELLSKAAAAGLVERLPGRKAGWTVPEEAPEPVPEPMVPGTHNVTTPMPTWLEEYPAEPLPVEVSATPEVPTWSPPDWTPEDIAEWNDEREAIAWEGQLTLADVA